VSGIREWFRWYKTPDGKPLNAFGYGEAALTKSESMDIIKDLQKEWKNLYEGTTEQGKMWLK